MSHFYRSHLQIIALLLVLNMIAAVALAENVFDSPDTIAVSTVLPAHLTSGKGYQVTDLIYADGMMYSFSLWTPQGWYRPRSAAMLEVRIAEARAMAALASMQDDPLFLEGLTDHIGTTFKSTGQAIRHPLKALKAVPLGLESLGEGIQARAEQGKVAGEEGRLSYMRTKRALAADLGVDPYSSNEQLQHLLDTVSASRNAGQLAGRIAGAFVGGGTGTFISVAQVNKNLQSKLRDMSAPQLQKENAETLRSLGFAPADISSFLSKTGYTASRCTAITHSLRQLSGVRGASDYLNFLQPSSNPEVSLYHQIQIAMAASYNQAHKPLVQVEILEGTALFTDASGGKHVFAPLDHLLWTPLAEERLRAVTTDHKIDLWITGTATEQVKKHLQERNVTLHEKAGSILLAGLR